MDTDILSRLRVDPGRRTIGELLQERESAANEIQQLRLQLARKRGNGPLPALKPTHPGSSEKVLLRLRDVCQMIGVSRSTIYKRIGEKRFPEPIRLSERTVRWSAEAISIWWQAQR